MSPKSSMRARTLSMALVVAAGFAACGGDSKPGPTPTDVTSLTISGPPQIAPGETVAFTATATYSNGSRRDVTDKVAWMSLYEAVLRPNGPGHFLGVTTGEAQIQARWGTDASEPKPVLVLPAGTFKLSGTVMDASGGVEGVRIEAESGAEQAARRAQTTILGGKYGFYGVAGIVKLHVSARGYETQDLTVTVSEHTVRDVTLTTTEAQLDVSGTWTLSLSASSPCSDAWPQAVRQREISTTITQQGTRLEVTFNGPTVIVSAKIPGRIAGTAFSFTIEGLDFYYSYPADEFSLLERLSPTDWVATYGTAEGTGDRSVIGGTFRGGLAYFVTPANATIPPGHAKTCIANSEFTLRRQ